MKRNELEGTNDIDARLARLAEATTRVRPRADFTARVLAATANAPTGSARKPGFWDDLPRIARRLVPVAALAALVGVAWGVTNDDAVDDALAGTYGATELEW